MSQLERPPELDERHLERYFRDDDETPTTTN